MLHIVEHYDPVKDVYVMQASLTVTASVEVNGEKLLNKSAHLNLKREVKNKLESMMLDQLKAIVKNGEIHERT